MSAEAKGRPGVAGRSSKDAWIVRAAVLGDAHAVAAGVSSLLDEMGEVPSDRPVMEAVARSLITDSGLGCVFLGQAGEAVVAVLAASWQTAMHAGGRYCLIQDLWVGPAWRDDGIGVFLMDGLVARCRTEGLSRIEVGMPTYRFADLRKTEAFYVQNRFAPVGARMRRTLRALPPEERRIGRAGGNGRAGASSR